MNKQMVTNVIKRAKVQATHKKCKETWLRDDVTKSKLDLSTENGLRNDDIWRKDTVNGDRRGLALLTRKGIIRN